MSKKAKILIVFFVSLALCAAAHADELLVPAEYPTIQAAIDGAYDGDVVLVADGTYTGEGNRDIDFLGKAITVRSEFGPENCIIDCNATREEPHRGFKFHSGESPDSVVAGFTITNGYASGDWPEYGGGGIYCYDSSPTITNCTINENKADWDGGGISCNNSSPTITNCIINGNLAVGRGGNSSYGGGIYCNYKSKPTITNCTISNNSAWYGGGIICRRDSNAVISNCTISNNSARYLGGGISCFESSPTITSCIITNNLIRSGGWGGGGGIACWQSSSIIKGCIISENMSRAGGGAIYCEETNPIIRDCTITHNSAERNGGGIYCEEFSRPSITNCTIIGNDALEGGGMYNYGSDPMLTNCTFVGNSAPNGNALACDSWRQQDPSNIQLTNCILWNGGNEIWNNDNSTITITYSDVQGGYEGEGNIDADPLFIDSGYWDVNDTPYDVNDDFWVEGDYHLLPDSPCIDTGDPNYIAEPNETDLDGNPRIRGDAIDMGAYETIIHEARLIILPRVINRKRSKPRIMAWLHLPQGINRDQIDSDTPLVLYPVSIEAMRQFVFQNRRRGAVSIFAVFDKAELMDAIDNSGRVQLQVLGYLRQPGQYYSGYDTIRIIAGSSKPQRQCKQIVLRR